MPHLVDSALVGMTDAGRLIATLQEFNVRHVEQLLSLMLSPSGRGALKHAFDWLDLEQVESFLERDLSRIQVAGLNLGRSGLNSPLRPKNRWQQRGIGFDGHAQRGPLSSRSGLAGVYEIFAPLPKAPPDVDGPTDPLRPRFDALLAAFPQQVPSGHRKFRAEPRWGLPQPKDQGERGTCVAFALNSMLASFIELHGLRPDRPTAFSEQYLYFRAKEQDSINGEGTTLECGLTALRQHGVCYEHMLPYRDFHDWSHRLLFQGERHNLDFLDCSAKQTRVIQYFHLPKHDLVESIKACLRRRLPVAVGVAVFRDAWNNDFSIWRGEIQLPLVRVEDDGERTLLDVCEGGHAITIMGYEDDENERTTRPGGGAFIFKNSWGTDWAMNNSHGRGYGLIPYSYIEEYCIEACTVSCVELDGMIGGKDVAP